MTAISVSAPFPILTDIDGDPLEAGYVYIGQANLDPVAFPKSAYWDASLTTPAAQPIRTTGGYPVRNGSPARIYTGGDYSIRINNKNGTLVYSSPAATDRMDSAFVGYDGGTVQGVLDAVTGPNGAASVGYTPSGTGAVATTVQSKLRETVSVKDFGAVGDGVTDDYAALKAAATYINSKGGGRLAFPPGHYYLDRYVTASNGVTDPMVFENCNGLEIVGYGAKISTKGDYYRDVSSTRGLSVFRLKNCSNVLIHGFEIDGNVDQTTSAAGLGEPPTFGISGETVYQCTVMNVYVHHMITDGVFWRDGIWNGTNLLACRNVTMFNVKSRYNGRQGMSIVQLRYGTFINCEFSYTGRGSIAFSPQAGMTIEPGRSTATPIEPMDVNTGEIEFINCLFTENTGPAAAAGYALSSDGIRFSGCQFIGSSEASGVSLFIIENTRGIVENCVFDFGDFAGSRLAYFTFSTSTISRNIIKNNTFYIRKANQQIVLNQSAGTIFDGNNIRAIGTSPGSGTQYFIASYDTNAVVKENTVFVAKEMYSDATADDSQVVLYYTHGTFKGNKYTTDLLAASGSTGKAHFCGVFGADVVNVDEKYAGTAPGIADTFRPIGGSTFDTTALFNRNTGNPLLFKGENVGIGTATPGTKLDIQPGTVTAVGALASSAISVEAGSGAVGNLSQIGFGYTNSGTTTNVPAALGFVTTVTSGNTLGDLFFATRSTDSDAAPSERVRVKSTGSVRFIPIATPSTAEAGDVYYDSGTNKLRCYNGTIWSDLF